MFVNVNVSKTIFFTTEYLLNYIRKTFWFDNININIVIKWFHLLKIYCISSLKFIILESNLKNEDESDDDLIIVETFVQQTIRKFFPVDYNWQFKMCNILNLNIIEQINSIESKPLNFPTVFRDVRGDGNCLFRSLSYCITGSEDSHYKIRKQILNVIIIKSNYNFNELYLLIIIIFRSYWQMNKF